MKNKIKEILIISCVSYTIISIIGGMINALGSNGFDNFLNTVYMLVWTFIAVMILYSYYIFEDLPTLLLMAIQYSAALLVVLGTIWITGIFGELHPDAYFDAFRSFTVFYVLGAAVFYIAVFIQAKQADQKVQKLRRNKKNRE